MLTIEINKMTNDLLRLPGGDLVPAEDEQTEADAAYQSVLDAIDAGWLTFDTDFAYLKDDDGDYIRVRPAGAFGVSIETRGQNSETGYVLLPEERLDVLAVLLADAIVLAGDGKHEWNGWYDQ